ncbi:MAG: acyl-CoA thioesterase [Prevotellaceae bacterium]|nr:acyl-CoA thioesterase [Prevotellaceae bacterium]
MMRKCNPAIASLTDTTTIRVRFSEVDSMQIVWHGQYIRYFEDGRESFGKRYGISYMDIYNNGFMAPLVELACQFKKPLTVGDEAIVETRYINTDAAKIQFDYIIYKADDNLVVATGSSIQVFLNTNRELELLNPEFYLDWKKKWGII